jgi:hypothetical protein
MDRASNRVPERYKGIYQRHDLFVAVRLPADCCSPCLCSLYAAKEQIKEQFSKQFTYNEIGVKITEIYQKALNR